MEKKLGKKKGKIKFKAERVGCTFTKSFAGLLAGWLAHRALFWEKRRQIKCSQVFKFQEDDDDVHSTVVHQVNEQRRVVARRNSARTAAAAAKVDCPTALSCFSLLFSR